MVRYANIDDAKKAVLPWNGQPASVTHLGDRGNSIFSFLNSENKLQIIRFTDPDFRTLPELKAELNFITYLYNSGVPVARPLKSKNHQFYFNFPCQSGDLICSSIAFADGNEIQEDSPLWNNTYFYEWGKNLGLIHKAASQYQIQPSEPKRWIWSDEILIKNSHLLIPQSDQKTKDELQEIIDICMSLEINNLNYGLIHADHAPQNFRYDQSTQIITAFDFGNCCYHWFISDLAISLSTVRRKKNREQIRENILAGYSQVFVLPPNYSELIELFIRLRVVYVYLSRLHLWSVDTTVEQKQNIELLRNMVHTKSGWKI